MSQSGNRLYSQIEIIILSKLPPTTVKRWLDFFSDLVPSIRKGDLDYYHFETLELLKRISELRNEKYRLNTIRNILLEEALSVSKEGFHEQANSGKRMDGRQTRERFAASENPQAIILSLNVLADELFKIARQLECLSKE
jgi:DNA-binding transcriptional MerR regulator